MGGGNDEGIYSIVNWGWDDEPPYETPVKWHTGEADTDPWEWHKMVIKKGKDIASAKLFFNKTGYITKEWYPYFLAARRQNLTFDEQYDAGNMGQWEKKIYECVLQNGKIAMHKIKAFIGVDKEDSSKYERALVSLQMKMYITGCGDEQKISAKGEPFGWPSIVFCTTEDYMGNIIFEKAAKITVSEATEKITEQVYKLNPNAVPKKILKFIKG